MSEWLGKPVPDTTPPETGPALLAAVARGGTDARPPTQFEELAALHEEIRVTLVDAANAAITTRISLFGEDSAPEGPELQAGTEYSGLLGVALRDARVLHEAAVVLARVVSEVRDRVGH